MSDETEKLKQLQERLLKITQQQEAINNEIWRIKIDLSKALQEGEQPIAEQKIIAPQQTHIQQNVAFEKKPEPIITPPAQPYTQPPFHPKKKSDIEKFIGENLLSKIGILILIIGIGIGVKYAIDRGWMGPMIRVLFGYFCSSLLIGTALFLKKKYHNFSAVLLGGGIASAYFTTYFAAVTYEIIPRGAAYPVMICMTMASIFAAIKYKREVIAHIGLWGAYAVPFLLGSNTGKTEWLFTYMLIMNVGIVTVSYTQKWKVIYPNAFVTSWIIFITSVIFKFNDAHIKIDFLFATAFFLLFLVSSLLLEWRKKEKDLVIENILVIANAFVFAIVGSILLFNITDNTNYIGVFLFMNAALYTFIAAVLYFFKSREVMFRIIIFLGILAYGVAVPIQFTYMQIPLLWALALPIFLLLKKYARINLLDFFAIPFCIAILIASYIVWGMQLSHLHLDWQTFLRQDFLWSIITVALFAVGYLLVKKDKEESAGKTTLVYIIGGTLILFLFCVFLFEIIAYFRYEYLSTSQLMCKGLCTEYNDVLIALCAIWILVYSLLFLLALKLINIFIQKQKPIFVTHQILLGGISILFLCLGLPVLYYLDNQYLYPPSPPLYLPQNLWINIRYILFASYALLILAQALYRKKQFIGNQYSSVLIFIMHFVILVVVSDEMMHWATITHTPKIDKYGLSIFWGIYALGLVGFGIFKNSKAYRIAGIIVIAITLIKLFFYDITNLGTLPKTLLFLAIGALLLLISFLYNKYKDVIGVDKQTEDN